jgi:hypothetical protein
MGPAVTSSRRARSLGAVAGAALGSLVVLPSRLALILAELNGGDISNSDTTSRRRGRSTTMQPSSVGVWVRP